MEGLKLEAWGTREKNEDVMIRTFWNVVMVGLAGMAISATAFAQSAQQL